MKDERRSNFIVRERRRPRPAQPAPTADHLEKIFHSVPQLLWTAGPDGRVELLSEQWRHFLTCETADLKDDGWLSFVHPDDVAGTIAHWKRSLSSGRHYRAHYRICCADGEYRWILAKATPGHDESGKIERWYGSCTDIHDHVIAQDALRRSEAAYRSAVEASLDSIKVLGLDGRVLMMNESAVRAMRYERPDLLDGVAFASLWPEDARPAIDEALATAASGKPGRFNALRSTRSGEPKWWDVVVTPVTDATGEATRLLAISRDVTAERKRSQELLWASEHDALTGLPNRRERAVSCGASIGGAIYPDDATSANDLFKLADTALYSLKSAGRGGTKLFQSGMLEDAQRAASQLSVARLSVTDSTVVPYFQPKVRLSDNQICGFEALLRWNHPRLGLQLPDTIEEAFKDYELASRIGELMQRKVVAAVAGWRRQGIAFGRVSINAAPVEFLRDDYSERLLALLERKRIPGEMLEIEVTEHALLEASGRYVARALDRLKAAGVLIALDDFGTGSSSLSHLRDFPVDIVKIDKSFVQSMASDREIAAIVSAVISLAHSLGMETVAEGIETPDQLAMLRDFGCHVAQGYHFGRPMPAEGASAVCQLRKAA